MLERLTEYNHKLVADYHQFYLQDEDAEGDLSNSWTQEATDNLLALGRGTIGVGTARSTEVPVTLQISSDAPNDEDFSEWDQVNECSIEVPSGRLVIAGCIDYFPDAVRLSIEPGTYRARVYYGKLDELSEDGEQGDDHYRIVLWPGASAETKVLKRWKPI